MPAPLNQSTTAATQGRSDQQSEPEARWPALIAILAAGGIYGALPGSLAVGPPWLLPSIALVLGAGTMLAHRRRLHRLNILLGYVVSAVLTAFLLWSSIRLVRALPSHR